MKVLGGVDIGGTKCAVVLGRTSESGVELLDKIRFPTPASPGETLDLCVRHLESLVVRAGVDRLEAVGISCGGPLDSQKGLICSPPNLPAWDRVDVCTPFADRFHAPVGLQNDANACALAEWKWGAGRGTRNMVFLTFGTGMGAGLILDGRLYSGSNDMAGEVGHLRLEQEGPIGYGKLGSFEGFCSGGGIARLARAYAQERLASGEQVAFCKTLADLDDITAEKVGLAAQAGDEDARRVWEVVGRQLGRGLALVVDILNPERIVIGSIYARQQQLLEPIAMGELQREALATSLAVCSVVPSELGERVGDFASLSVAMYALER
ncbi:ROK family protein [Alicyclobacillus fastidiosus]|uniref:ROK family protein n=1 Tax=Alicyclobacillus fastidiosus TaxID=392011 RepID=A0ABV5AAB8_9BACL|nr:ROK family protein [Alicyclobacillus fastidiosus]WEH07712.1 ROK family protein [Alicyclobacillus fastidiosus]